MMVSNSNLLFFLWLIFRFHVKVWGWLVDPKNPWIPTSFLHPLRWTFDPASFLVEIWAYFQGQILLLLRRVPVIKGNSREPPIPYICHTTPNPFWGDLLNVGNHFFSLVTWISPKMGTSKVAGFLSQAISSHYYPILLDLLGKLLYSSQTWITLPATNIAPQNG